MEKTLADIKRTLDTRGIFLRSQIRLPPDNKDIVVVVRFSDHTPLSAVIVAYEPEAFGFSPPSPKVRFVREDDGSSVSALRDFFEALTPPVSA